MNERQPACWICLGAASPDASGGRYHRACLEALFGVSEAPRVAFDRLATAIWADEHAGRLSISGVQPKAPAALADGGRSLILVEQDSTHIIKPPHVSYPHVPENEHLTMRLGRLVGLTVAEHGLVELEDGAVAYVTRRFDRMPSGRADVVDFCQLAGKDPVDKEFSSAEECAAIARAHAVPEAVFALFRLFVFAYWVRNGNLHLKNLMLRQTPEGTYALAPAYDLLCTEPYNVKGMVLPVSGERVNIARKHWLDFAEIACGIERARAAETIDAMLANQPEAEALIERSALPNREWKRKYRHLLAKRTRQLAGLK